MPKPPSTTRPRDSTSQSSYEDDGHNTTTGASLEVNNVNTNKDGDGNNPITQGDGNDPVTPTTRAREETEGDIIFGALTKRPRTEKV